MENKNSVKWGKPVEVVGVFSVADLMYTSKCGLFVITKAHWYSNKRRGSLQAAYSITEVATGVTRSCKGLSGGRKWAELLAALATREQAFGIPPQ